MEADHKKPAPPFPAQGMSPPGLEAEMDPQPRYRAPKYCAADKLAGLVAIITGGDSGIGRAVALMFAREGADVAIMHLAEEQKDAEATAEHVKQIGRRVILMAGDVSDAGFCESAAGRCVDELGRLDVLVNNAAYHKHRDSLDDISLEQWDRTFQTNIYGYFHMIKAVVPHMKPGNCIINTGPITGLEGSKGLLNYSATKGAIHAFTKSLAHNLLPKGIGVNCIAPGPVWTPLNPAERSDDDIRDFGSDTSLRRPAQPEEIAPAYVFFASNPDSSFITGETLPILGRETVAGLEQHLTCWINGK